MDALRYADELKGVEELGIPSGALQQKASSKEIDMALRLIDDMSEKWQPEKFKDTFRDDLMARIEDKIKQGQTEEITPPAKGEKEAAGADVIDLMALLKKSVDRKQERQEKPKRKAARRAGRKAA
jgi:DNA end-binding protein Ku